MGATKTQLFEDDIINSAEMFKALGHPARLAAYLLILKETDKDISQKEIVQKIGLSQSTLSVHLNKLEQAGVITKIILSKDEKSSLSYRANQIAIDFFEKSDKKSSIKIDYSLHRNQRLYNRIKSTVGWCNYFES